MTIKGINSVISDLRKFGKDAERDIAGVTELVARNIEKDAKSNVVANFGKLGQSIQAVKVDSLNWKIEAGGILAPYAPFVEFGTGTKAVIPDELKSLASQFKGKGSGTFEAGLDSIKIWCKAKGIEESAAYPILMSLIKNGQKPQPFLYPALLRGRIQYLEKLKKVLSKYAKS